MVVIKAKEVGLWKKSFGLIGKNKPENLLFKTRFGIHTFGMRFPIDVLVLDKNYKVIKFKETLLPNNFFFWNPRYNLVLELPSGTVKQLAIKRHKNIVVDKTI